MYRLRLLALLSVLGGSACDGGPTRPEQLVVVQTQRPEYEPGETVLVTMENLGLQAVEFIHCSHRLGLVLERLESGRWAEADERTTACVGTQAGVYALKSGDIYRDSLEVPLSGTYRIIFPVWNGAGPLESNTFLVLPDSGSG